MEILKEHETARPYSQVLHLGIDVGSTTTKAVVFDPLSHTVLFSSYERHNACQKDSVISFFQQAERRFPQTQFRIAFCGSGGKSIASILKAPFVQEVVANAIALRKSHPFVRTAIELGGQDAKIIFFSEGTKTDQSGVSDMRMNGSCAGGTGAFIDEIASLLNVPTEQFNELASRGTTVYPISGRCGVYAKTDIQPLLNQGIPKEDIALSTFHAIVKQTVGGLAQGLEIKTPLAFEGGPLTFNPVLIQAFCERLKLNNTDIVVPESPEKIIALGAALSLDLLFTEDQNLFTLDYALSLLNRAQPSNSTNAHAAPLPFFESPEERLAFEKRQATPFIKEQNYQFGDKVKVYLGIDSGSTTTKLVFLDENEELIEEFYAPNEGDPIKITQEALVKIAKRYAKQGITLEVGAVGTTGYGELMLHRALNADYHVVETVAHAAATTKYIPDASFILDIGGQDMKAITLDQGILTDIIVNEACSSGCGSFLENLAQALGIKTSHIAEAAFSAISPAQLGSRCTVFINSCIVTEQKNGKTPEDIMAGLCRSIIENVFTKVIRMSNFEKLGSRIVAQGGTFKNDAVLRAFEQYLGKEVVRAPYPGVMGAIGAALLAKRNASKQTSFVGFAALEELYFTTESDNICPFCSNACNRTVVTFSGGAHWVTGNRCSRGQVVGNFADEATRGAFLRDKQQRKQTPNLFEVREKLLFRDYRYEQIAPPNKTVIGIPRVLEFWDSMPFWKTLFQSLGFTVKISHPSSRSIYEQGISSVTSDTVCFPAKLVHGHLRDLVDQNVDRIFMPSITSKETENVNDTSVSVCAVVKGYPIVVQNSDNPFLRWGIPFDNPLFHWYSPKDRNEQIISYLAKQFGFTWKIIVRALQEAERALCSFKNELQDEGAHVLQQMKQEGRYAIVLAARPYHNDSLVNHDLPHLFVEKGIPVIPADAIPGIHKTDLTKSRLEIVNSFHARMLSAARIAALHPQLEYVQVVSFGCGHDAVLSDEITRLMKEESNKIPLVLKVDESDIRGPLRIRVESFIETVNTRRKNTVACSQVQPLKDPYPVKYEVPDQQKRSILVPNVSRAFCHIMTAAIAKQGVRAEPLPLGSTRAIALGKKYVHNDICFPAQMVIGEALAALESGNYNLDEVAIGTGKLIGDCRLTHYAALLRKALDDAGYKQVPIITNDGTDQRNLHPGYRMGIESQACIAFGLPMIDALEQLLRKIRPYELTPGQANAAFDEAVHVLAEGIREKGMPGACRAFKRSIALMKEVPYDRSKPRPQVLVIGEYLLNFHPGANYDIEDYLEDNGMEVIEPQMADVYQKSYFHQLSQVQEYKVKKPFTETTWLRTANGLFGAAHLFTNKTAAAHPLFEAPPSLKAVTRASDDLIHHTFDSGEGFLIPAEIIHHAQEGVRAFAILQPFGCLPNHICGRGVSAALKKRYPDAQILALDYDPDVSFANIENRLQMLILGSQIQNATEVMPNTVLEEKSVLNVERLSTRVHGLSADIIPALTDLSDEVAQSILHTGKQQIDTTR